MATIDPPPNITDLNDDTIKRPKRNWQSWFRQVTDCINESVPVADLLNIVPIKMAAVKFGEDAGNNVIILNPNPFNIASVTRQGVGQYRVALENTTIRGVDVTPEIYGSVYASNYPALHVASTLRASGVTGTFDIFLNEFYLQGQNMRTRPYELVVGDIVSVFAYLNYNDNTLDWPTYL